MPSSSASASTRALVLLVVALPLDEVLPLAGDRAVAGLVAVAHHQEGVVVEGVGDAVLVQVVGAGCRRSRRGCSGRPPSAR